MEYRIARPVCISSGPSLTAVVAQGLPRKRGRIGASAGCTHARRMLSPGASVCYEVACDDGESLSTAKGVIRCETH